MSVPEAVRPSALTARKLHGRGGKRSAELGGACYPGCEAVTIVTTVRRAIESERLVLEVDGDLLVIPIRSVKYVQVSPSPAYLPGDVLRHAHVSA